jgi:repressor LexA
MDKKTRIYEYIKAGIKNRGFPPTIREIGKRFDISSTNGVRYFLDKLEQEGLITRQHRTARGIRLVQSRSISNGRLVPLVGQVPAGPPDFSEENIEDLVLLDERIAKRDDVFAVRVIGDSMIDAGINDGDIAIVRPNASPQNGDVVVALLDDEVTLKRYARTGENIFLKPENEAYPVIKISSHKGKNVRIIGNVIAIVRRY